MCLLRWKKIYKESSLAPSLQITNPSSLSLSVNIIQWHHLISCLTTTTSPGAHLQTLIVRHSRLSIQLEVWHLHRQRRTLRQQRRCHFIGRIHFLAVRAMNATLNGFLKSPEESVKLIEIGIKLCAHFLPVSSFHLIWFPIARRRWIRLGRPVVASSFGGWHKGSWRSWGKRDYFIITRTLTRMGLANN